MSVLISSPIGTGVAVLQCSFRLVNRLLDAAHGIIEVIGAGFYYPFLEHKRLGQTLFLPQSWHSELHGDDVRPIAKEPMPSDLLLDLQSRRLPIRFPYVY